MRATRSATRSMTSQQRRGETETESIEREDSQSAFEVDTDETDERPRCLVNCPFAVVREGFAKCTDLGEGRKSEASVIFHLLNAWLMVQVRNHLQKIRIKDGQQIGFDFCHREADPLWDTPQVQGYLEGVP